MSASQLSTHLNSQFAEVSAYFKSSTSVSYTFKEPYELNRNSSSVQASSIYSDMTLRAENVSLDFRTTQAPALLLYVGSYYREYLAVLLNRNGLENSAATTVALISPLISFHCCLLKGFFFFFFFFLFIWISMSY